MMMTLFVLLVFACLYGLLGVYFFYTMVACIKGAAPIPSFRTTVQTIIKLAEISPGEVVLDLGSGDGRILIAAAKSGARSIGYEINPILVLVSRAMIMLRGAHGVTVRRDNFWNADLSGVDVLTVYLIPMYMARLKEKVCREMRSGSRVVLAQFPFPDWEPEVVDGRVYRYRIP